MTKTQREKLAKRLQRKSQQALINGAYDLVTGWPAEEMTKAQLIAALLELASESEASYRDVWECTNAY